MPPEEISAERSPLEDKLESIRYCIVNGYDEDAFEHITDLLRGLHLKNKPDAELTDVGLKLKAMWKVCS
jgi:hypothetical protein